MSSENLRKFVDAVTADAALKAKVDEIVASTKGEDVGWALEKLSAELGFPVSAEEFRAPVEGELGAEELESVSGGYVLPWDPIFRVTGWGN
jgi:predicted ribosomally synthesized peptide with nif11-like leader